MAPRRLTAYAPYAGRAGGYADLAFAKDFVVCADLEGTVFRYHAESLELQAKQFCIISDTIYEVIYIYINITFKCIIIYSI